MDPQFDFGQHRPVQPAYEGCSNVGQVFLARVAATPDAPAYFEKVQGRWQRGSWSQLLNEAAAVAAGLRQLGVGPGDRVAILGPTTAQWVRYDLGAHLLGAVTVGIYPLQSVDQVRFLLEHSECRVLFVSGAQELATAREAAAGADLLALVPWEEELATDSDLVSPRRFSGQEPDADWLQELEEGLQSLPADEVAILIYTSGTTGPPKGAMITHANLLELMRQQAEFFPFYEDDLLFSFLPLAHASERNLNYYLRLSTGVAAAYASSMGTVLAELQEVRPTVFGSVPRLFEKAYAKLRGDVSGKPALVRALFAWAEGVGRRYLPYRLQRTAAPLRLRLTYALASRLVFRKIHRAFGGRVRACITGAAPISKEILELFWSAGLPIYEAYGMTEATVLTHIAREGAIELGTVGLPLQGLEQRLGEDDEVLVRGPLVFRGYWRNEEATAEAVQDGWLHTGDIGRIDERGFLRITDRKKHLIITAGGKNVAPANIERAIKDQSPLISQVHAHGDRRPYISALIAPSPLETLAWGLERQLITAEEAARLEAELLANPAARSPELAQAMARVTTEPAFLQQFLEPVQQGNRQLARVERVRRFFVLERDLSQEEGELTPTLKIKRRVLEQRFQKHFDELYSGALGLDAEPGGGTS